METPPGQEGTPNQSLFSERVTRAIQFTQVMESAEKKARMFNHDSIRTDDLLLGLMSNPLIKATLLEFNVDSDRVRRPILFTSGTDEKPPNREIRLSHQTKRVIELAGGGKVDLQTDTPLIDLLIAVVSENEGRGAQILESLGVHKDNLDKVIETYANLKEKELAKKQSSNLA